MNPTPVFSRAGVRLFCGDARELIHHLEVDERTVAVLDPVWPNSQRTTLAGREDPQGLLAEVLTTLVARGLRRAILILGCDSDPRFLAAVPPALPFRRTTWLRYAVPSYKGPVINGADVAFVFGDFRMAFKGQRMWPGEILANTPRDSWRKKNTHPCPRRVEHIRGLLVGYCRTGDRVIDPFAGSATTLAVALQLGRAADGIEIEQTFCDEARENLASLVGDEAVGSVGPLFSKVGT